MHNNRTSICEWRFRALVRFPVCPALVAAACTNSSSGSGGGGGADPDAAAGSGNALGSRSQGRIQ